MSKLLSDWSPSEAAIKLIKLNGLDDEKINKSLEYLRSQKDLNNIDDVKGYDNWDSLFIMFCVKANKNANTPEGN